MCLFGTGKRLTELQCGVTFLPEEVFDLSEHVVHLPLKACADDKSGFLLRGWRSGGR